MILEVFHTSLNCTYIWIIFIESPREWVCICKMTSRNDPPSDGSRFWLLLPTITLIIQSTSLESTWITSLAVAKYGTQSHHRENDTLSCVIFPTATYVTFIWNSRRTWWHWQWPLLRIVVKANRNHSIIIRGFCNRIGFLSPLWNSRTELRVEWWINSWRPWKNPIGLLHLYHNMYITS